MCVRACVCACVCVLVCVLVCCVCEDQITHVEKGWGEWVVIVLVVGGGVGAGLVAECGPDLAMPPLDA